jgi:hypothetical protein
MKTEPIAAVAEPRAEPAGGWTSYCRLVASLSARQAASQEPEKEDTTNNASTH